MPCDYKKYHPYWKQISRSIIRDRAKNHCELCGVENESYIFRYEGAPVAWFYCTKYDRNILQKKNKGKAIKVVLTCHHIDYDIKNNKYYNLLALCQRCHNKLDISLRIRNRKARRGN